MPSKHARQRRDDGPHAEGAQRRSGEPAPPASGELARMTDAAAPAGERQAIAAQLGPVIGNAALARMLAGPQLMRQPETQAPPGRGISTRFGDYWIVPDDTNMSHAVEGEQITESEFAALQQCWDKLQDGSGSIKIQETDESGKKHAGFKDKIMGLFGSLLSQPVGRGMVIGLVNGSQTVTILPSDRRLVANATRGAGSLENPDGTAGAGGSTTIRLDADLQDDSVVAFDASGRELAAPVWSILGHELIHAVHNAAGRNRRNRGASAPVWGNREEEETIGGPGLSENALRNEHGLPNRHGHGARDTRPAP